MQRRIGLHRDSPQHRIELLEPTGSANKGPGRAQASNEMRDGSFRLFPNLFGGGAVVGLPVGWVVVLIQVDESCGVFRGEPPRFPDRAVGTLQGIQIGRAAWRGRGEISV